MDWWVNNPAFNPHAKAAAPNGHDQGELEKRLAALETWSASAQGLGIPQKPAS